MSVTPFKVQGTQQALDDLRNRLERTRWRDELEDEGWDLRSRLALGDARTMEAAR